MTDELRDRLRHRNPYPDGSPVEPVTGPSARHLLETIMSTPLTKQAGTGPGLHEQSGAGPARPGSPLIGRRSRRSLAIAVSIACAAAVAVGANGLVDRDPPPRVAAALRLTLPRTDPLTSSCPVYDDPVAIAELAAMPVAFAGTVTELTPSAVTLTVDRWYRGGTATIVRLDIPEGFIAALDGVDLSVGQRYLLTARDGVIGRCGQSGPATPELLARFDGVFPTAP
jgi:hypothetical protein